MQLEWLILADAAQVVGGKLYLLGGGWDRITANRPVPFDQRMALSLSIKVPWSETNQRHNVEVEIFAEDTETEEPRSIAKMGGQFEIGRPPGIRQGQEQRVQLALEMTLRIDTLGLKTILARIEGQEMGRTEFVVAPGNVSPGIKPGA